MTHGASVALAVKILRGCYPIFIEEMDYSKLGRSNHE
jgi:hypothetical protein